MPLRHDVTLFVIYAHDACPALVFLLIGCMKTTTVEFMFYFPIITFTVVPTKNDSEVKLFRIAKENLTCTLHLA